MQSIEIANKQITYHHNITLTYQIKITKTRYTNKKTNKKYVRYKIRIPSELKTFLKNKRNLYFSINDKQIHITFNKKEDIIHKCKIQKNKFYERRDYSFNLSKKVFDLEDSTYLFWEVKIENGKIIDSIARLI